MEIFMRHFVLSMICLVLAACASSSSVVVGTKRSPISPEQVKIYLREPAKFEEVALLEASSRNSWSFSSQGKMDKVVERLKNEAAKIGANGILLTGTGNEYGGSVNSGFATSTASGNSAYGSGFGTSAPVIHKAGSAIAIYVTEK